MSAEGIPKNEAVPSNARESVKRILQEQQGTPEAREALNTWLDREQEKVEKGEQTNLEFNIAWAELYRDAGLAQEAEEAFDACAEIAFQEGDESRYAYCEQELKKLATS